jgi:HK97 family phage major capsid protein
VDTFQTMREDEAKIRIEQINERMRHLDSEFEGRAFPEEARAEFIGLKAERDGIETGQVQRKSRRRQLEALSRDASRTESERSYELRRGSRDFPMATTDALRAVNDLHERGEIREAAALRLDSVIRRDKGGGEAQYIAAISDRDYATAFPKMLEHGRQEAGVVMSDRERAATRRVFEATRAASLTGGSGGFAVPVVLDPTVLPTSDGALNTLRNISRVEVITGNTWEGVTSAGLTAAFTAEATEASDNAPTLAQPIAYVEKAQAFVPFSIEIGEDWERLQFEMARMFADAKDLLEAQKFVSGTGHSAHMPEGLQVGATAFLTSGATAAISVADLYSLKEALPPRFRPNATFLAADVAFDKVRRLVGPGSQQEMPVFDDGTGAGPSILRRPALQNTGMPTSLVTGATAITYGDFTQLLICDRIGMQVELVPMLFGSNQRPTGQRGLYAYWRTTSKVLDWQAFRSLKLL